MGWPIVFCSHKTIKLGCSNLDRGTSEKGEKSSSLTKLETRTVMDRKAAREKRIWGPLMAETAGRRRLRGGVGSSGTKPELRELREGEHRG